MYTLAVPIVWFFYFPGVWLVETIWPALSVVYFFINLISNSSGTKRKRETRLEIREVLVGNQVSTLVYSVRGLYFILEAERLCAVFR